MTHNPQPIRNRIRGGDLLPFSLRLGTRKRYWLRVPSHYIGLGKLRTEPMAPSSEKLWRLFLWKSGWKKLFSSACRQRNYRKKIDHDRQNSNDQGTADHHKILQGASNDGSKKVYPEGLRGIGDKFETTGENQPREKNRKPDKNPGSQYLNFEW